MDGYIKIYRSMFEHDIWKKKPFSEAQAWIDLLQMANIKDGKAWVKGTTVPVKRGQLLRSMDELASRWGWNRKAARKFLETLKGEEMVSVDGSVYGTLITIEKYTVYNPAGTEDGTADGIEMGQRWDRDGTSNKKERKKERKNNKGTPTDWIHEIVPEELQDLFIEWADMRKTIKKPITSRATVTRAWAKLERLSKNRETQKAIIGQSIDGCWASFWELKDKPEAKRYPEFKPVQETAAVPMTAAQRQNQEKIIAELKKVF